jgi:hypothetical protein
MANYTTQLNNLKNAQRKAAVADLQNTRNTALSNLQAEQQQNAANYAAQRNTANAQNRLSARNFQEYLANTGRANSGLGAQANLQAQNNLQTSMNNIYGAENAALADIARRRTDAQNAYSSGLASANANIEANYIQNLLKQQQQDWENKMALKQFNESVRQYNQNRKDSLRGFSSGGRRSGSGGSSGRGRYGGGSSSQVTFNDTPTTSNNSVASKLTNAAKLTANAIKGNLGSQNVAVQKAAKVGQRYVKQVKDKKGNVVSQLWMKTKNGKDYRVA